MLVKPDSQGLVLYAPSTEQLDSSPGPCILYRVTGGMRSTAWANAPCSAWGVGTLRGQAQASCSHLWPRSPAWPRAASMKVSSGQGNVVGEGTSFGKDPTHLCSVPPESPSPSDQTNLLHKRLGDWLRYASVQQATAPSSGGFFTPRTRQVRQGDPLRGVWVQGEGRGIPG